MIALALLVVLCWLGAVVAAIYGLSRLAETSLFTWEDDE